MREVSDQEQLDMIKKWWVDYGRLTILMVVLGLAIGFGWRYWKQRDEAHLQAASVQYQELLMHQNASSTEWRQQVTRIQTDFSKTPYAGMALLLSAKRESLEADYTGAETDLQWVIAHGTMPAQRDLAFVRLARLYAATKKPDAAIDLLKGAKLTMYQPVADRILSGLYKAKGNTQLATTYYKKAVAGFQQLGIDDPFLKMQDAS